MKKLLTLSIFLAAPAGAQTVRTAPASGSGVLGASGASAVNETPGGAVAPLSLGTVLPAGVDPLALDLTMGRFSESWRHGGARLERLGQGALGFVDVHPTLPEVALKTIAPSFENWMAGASAGMVADMEEGTSARISQADLGPLYLGRKVIRERHVLAKERIFGETIQRLFDGRRYGPDEHALVLDFVDRMAAEGVMVDDLLPRNLMLGSTPRRPERRVWLVDGGALMEPPSGLDREGRRLAILDQNVVLLNKFPSVLSQPIPVIRRFGYLLEEGLRKSAETTRWQRFRTFLRETWEQANFPEK